MLKIWEKYLLSIRKAGSSCGAIIQVRASGVPIGLGAPIYSKLDSQYLLMCRMKDIGAIATNDIINNLRKKYDSKLIIKPNVITRMDT